MKTRAAIYWLAFAVCQVLGLVLFVPGDPRAHVVLKTAGLVLLLPGTLAGLAFAEIGVGVDISLATVLGGILLANFGAWYGARRIWLAVRSRVRTEK
jgi:bacteriorhodopsin